MIRENLMKIPSVMQKRINSGETSETFLHVSTTSRFTLFKIATSLGHMTRCSLERSTAQRQCDLIASVASVCTMYLECSLSIAHIFQRLCVAAYLPLLFKGSFRENLAEMILCFLKCTVCFGYTVPLILARRVLFGLCFILS